MKLPYVFRLAFRELRSSRRRVGVYMGSIALGVAALVSINSFRENVASSIRGQSRILLGADLELRSRQPFPDPVRAVLDSLALEGTPVSEVTSFASMALAVRTGLTRLVNVRAVLGEFPFYGAIETAPADRWQLLQSGRHALVDSTVMVQLEVNTGDTLAIGASQFVVIGALTRVPGEVGLRAAIGPRVYIPARYLEETGLLRFGSRARYATLLAMEDQQRDVLLERHRELFRSHVIRIDTAAEREEDLTQSLSLLARYLGLVGLIALLLGGIGVASAVHVYVKGKLDTIAVFRCLGATQRTMFTVYLMQALLLGVIGASVGVVLGAGVQTLLPSLFADFLPLEVGRALEWRSALAGLGIGVWVAVIFALHPLLAVRNVPPLKALRNEYEGSRRTDVPTYLTHAALLASIMMLSIWQAPSRAIGLGFTAAVIATTAVLWGIAFLVTRVTRRILPRTAPFSLRQGVSNLFRPHNQTVAVTLAVGFGVFLLATLYVVQWNLLERLGRTSYPERPNLFLFDIQRDQRSDVEAVLRQRGLPLFDVTPIVTARLADVKGRTVDELRRDSTEDRSHWPLTREYRNTYRDSLVASEDIVAGAWWTDTPRVPKSPGIDEVTGMPRISVEEDIAHELRVGVGDRITWNVQGRMIETVVASIRRVDWARFETNFFVVFEPGVLEEAPQSFVVLTRADDARIRAQVQRDLFMRSPNIAALDLTLVQDTLDRVLGSVALAIRFMALFSLLSGAFVLVGAIATSRFQRVKESALLKTLGARSWLITQILVTEYFTLGTLAALTGVSLAIVAGWALTRFFFELSFRLPALSLVGLWLLAAAVTTIIGTLGSRDVVRKAPLVVLREMGE